MAARVPGLASAVIQTLRVPFLRRTPTGFGWMSKMKIPGEVLSDWLKPLLSQRAIRRDLLRYLRGAKRGGVMEVNEPLRGFRKPVLIAWGAEDKVMPPEHARRFAELLPHAELSMIEGSRTLISEDQPQILAAQIRRFVRSVPSSAAVTPDAAGGPVTGS